IFPHAEAILEDFLIGAVEARIDEAFGAAGALAGDPFEMALARRRAGENEGRGREDRRLQGAFGQRWIEAVAHHQRRGFELVPADLVDRGLGIAARRGGGEDRVGVVLLVGHVVLILWRCEWMVSNDTIRSAIAVSR